MLYYPRRVSYAIVAHQMPQAKGEFRRLHKSMMKQCTLMRRVQYEFVMFIGFLENLKIIIFYK
jgi:hypothetical protein